MALMYWWQIFSISCASSNVLSRFSPKATCPWLAIKQADLFFKALKNRTACLIANHGQVAFGEDLKKTFELAQEIENICHQYINALRIGIPKILSKKEMKIVLGKFKNYKKG